MTLPPLDQAFGELFSFLDAAAYAWEPQIPERLQSFRRNAVGFDPLTRYFGLGLEVGADELCSGAGLPESLVPALQMLRPAVSRVGAAWVPHHHWSEATPGGDYVYLGRESLELAKWLARDPERFIGKNVLDLGSGSGALSFALAPFARRVLGLELSAAAVKWANAAARAQGWGNVAFAEARVGAPDADRQAVGTRWDAVVFNPPMAVPSGGARPFRDGGALGMEVPLAFLAFAAKHLPSGGEALFLATNPIVGGRAAFFDRLDRRAWRIEERKILDERFNQSLYRKEGYARLGIERVELWLVRLRRN